MKLQLSFLLLVPVFGLACASPQPKQKNLEKYPQCYHANVKLSNRCVERNEAGENVTALQLENEAYPGQYK